MTVFDHGGHAERGNDLTVAKGPVGTTKSRISDPHYSSQGDLAECSNYGGNRHYAEDVLCPVA